MNKRGFDFLWGLVLSVIIAIIAFSILLYFLLGIDTKGFTLDETCKLSVLTRATAPDIAKKALGLPLKCTTRKVCITDSLFGKCEEQFAGDDANRIVLSSDKDEAAKTVAKTVADSMLACWRMMGEGKLDLFGNPQDLLSDDAKASCVVCTRVAFDKDFVYKDKKTKELDKDFEKVAEVLDINKFIEENTAPQSQQTYLNLFTDSSIRSYGGEFKDSIGKSEGKATDEIAILFAQINTDKDPFEAGVNGALAAGTFLLIGNNALSPLGKTVSLFTKTAGRTFGIFTLVAEVAITAGVGVASGIKASNDQMISAAYCGEFTSSEEKKKGCSVVTAVDYNKIDEVNRLCGRILGNL